MDIIFMGTPEFAVSSLKQLYEEEDINIKLVVTQPDRRSGRGRKVKKSPIKLAAEELKLNIYQPEKIKSKEALETLGKYNVHYIIVVAYGQILNSEVLNLPRKGCINLHASLLPKYRGAAPINWALINGEEKTGITTMLMDEGLDTGDILMKKKIKIDKEINAGNLHDKLKTLGKDLLIDTIKGYEKNLIKPEKQDDENSSYAPMIDKELGKINWNKDGEDIHNLVRGLSPWPGAYTYYNDDKLKIYETTYIESNSEKKPGEIIEADSEGIRVQCNNGVINIKVLQLPGKRKMKVEEFLLGNKIDKNIILK